jgi:hypothetical protein
MNEIEAHTTLAKYVGHYRSRSYQYLATFARLGGVDTSRIAVSGGGDYKIEVHVRWEEEPGGSVKVSASISDANGREGRVLTQTFVVQPTGEFAEA